jgi:hypothetical protein
MEMYGISIPNRQSTPFHQTERGIRLKKDRQFSHKPSNLKGGHAMRAGIVFTGTGPILILATYRSFEDPNLVEKLKIKGG